MEQVKTHNKVLALVMTMAMAVALSLALAPAAFADTGTWYDTVTVTADAKNGTYSYSDAALGSSNVTITPCTTLADGTDNDTATVPKTIAGQYVEVTMQFNSSISGLQASDFRTYMQNNITIAGRSINSATYKRYVFNVNVNTSTNTVTFDISSVDGNYLTANFNGVLVIPAVSSTTIGNLLQYDVETLIDNGVTLQNNTGTYDSATNSRTFKIDHAANHRGMVHVLILDGDDAIFDGTGTFTNGGLTVHAHDFQNQTISDFASDIVDAANEIATDGLGVNEDPDYEFSLTNNAGEFVVTSNVSSGDDLRAYIYSYDYLNSISGSVGDISEPEWPNN